MPEAEVYFIVGALLLYLVDSGLALYGDELLFATGVRGWHNVAGGGQLLWGRRVLFPNPLLPAARLLRICWSPPAAELAATGQIAAVPLERAEGLIFRQALRPLQFGVAALLLSIAVALPATYYAFGMGLPLLLLVAGIYALNMSMAAWVWRVRAALELSARACLLLTVDLLLCPPFAINLVRKITLQQQPVGDPLSFAQARFGAPQLHALCALLSQRVRAELMADETEGAPRRKLQALIQRIEGLAP